MALTLISFIAFISLTELSLLEEGTLMGVKDSGIIGTYFLKICQPFFGNLGSKILIYGTFIISTLLIFKISIKNVTLLLLNFLIKTKKSKSKIFLKRLLKKITLLLFYVKKAPKPFSSQPASKKRKELETVVFKQDDTDRIFEDFMNDTDSAETIETSFPDPEPETTTPDNEIREKTPDTSTEISTTTHTKGDNSTYKTPPLNLLNKPTKNILSFKKGVKKFEENAKLLEETLNSFNVKTTVVNITPGPSVTRYELKPQEMA